MRKSHLFRHLKKEVTMLYYDNKIQALESMLNETKTLLENVKSNYSNLDDAFNTKFESRKNEFESNVKTDIKAELQSQITSTLHTETQSIRQEKEALKESLQNEIQETLNNIKQEVNTNLSSHIDTDTLLSTLKSELIEKKLNEIISELSTLLRQDESLKGHINDYLDIKADTKLESIKAEISPKIDENIQDNLAQITQNIAHNISEEGISLIANNLLQDRELKRTLSQILAKKLEFRDFENQVSNLIESMVNNTLASQESTILHLIQQAKLMESQNLCNLNEACHILTQNSFNKMALEYSQILEKQRQEFYNSLNGKDKVKKNIFMSV